MVRLLLTILLALVPISARADTSIVTDRQVHKVGQIVTSAGPWCADAHPEITGYDDRIVIEGSQRLYSWNQPLPAAPCGVYGYNYQAFGQYWDQKPPVPVAPLQLGQLTQFDFSYDLTMVGAAKANLLIEFFATAAPGDINTRQIEIGWLTNMPPETVKFFKSAKLIGSYKSVAGSTWEVRQAFTNGLAGGYVMIARSSDTSPLYNANMDGLSAIRFLIGASIVKPEWWINGLALGFEPLGGPGGALVRNFTVTYK